MKLCLKKSLQHIIKITLLAQEQKVFIIVSVSSGLKTLKSLGIIHRDIKLENIYWLTKRVLLTFPTLAWQYRKQTLH